MNKNKGLRPRKTHESAMRARIASEIQKLPHYFAHVRDQLELQKYKAQSIEARKNMLDGQKRLNYTQELDRIRGILSQTNPALRTETIDNLKRRQDELKSMGAKIVDEIK
jgi:hypothetical protein